MHLPAFGLLKQLGNHSRPTRLVAGTDTPACISMEVFIEEQQVAPVWVVLKFLNTAEDGSASLLIT